MQAINFTLKFYFKFTRAYLCSRLLTVTFTHEIQVDFEFLFQSDGVDLKWLLPFTAILRTRRHFHCHLVRHLSKNNSIHVIISSLKYTVHAILLCEMLCVQTEMKHFEGASSIQLIHLSRFRLIYFKSYLVSIMTC